MTERLLPVEEWPRLAGTEAETIWPQLDPNRAGVVVIEDGGQIVGVTVLMWALHADCVWIHPAHQRRGAVGRRLWHAVEHFARARWHVRGLMVAAKLDVMRRFLDRVGARELPGSQYAWVWKQPAS